MAGRLSPARPNWFDSFELSAIRFYAWMWHGATRVGPNPLPRHGPAIVIANHPSHNDPAFLLATSRRRLCFLHAREYFNVLLLRRLFTRIGCIPVARDGTDIAATRYALRCLERGEFLAIFPEGDISPSEDEMRPPRAGAALLALRSRAPVYPARIIGGPRSHHLLRDWLWPSRGARVIFGPAIDLSAYYGRPIRHALLAEVSQLFMRRIAELTKESGVKNHESGARGQKEPA